MDRVADAEWLTRALRKARLRERDARLERASSESIEEVPVHISTPPFHETGKIDDKDDNDNRTDEEHTCLDCLPDDIIMTIGHALLASEVRATLRLCSVSATMWSRLSKLHEAATRMRLHWLRPVTVGHEIILGDRSLVADGELAEDGLTLVTHGGVTHSWAAGTSLPTSGKSRWAIRIDKCATGRLVLGVCNEQNNCGWGLEPYTGACSRHSRDPETYLVDLIDRKFGPPAGFPCGHGSRLMAANLRGSRAEGSIIHFSLDADAGRLGFVVDEKGESHQLPKSHVSYPRRYELTGFPSSREHALRPWAMLYHCAGDRVTLHGCF